MQLRNQNSLPLWGLHIKQEWKSSVKTKTEDVVRRLPGRKADLGELCPKAPSAPSWGLPGWAERKRAGRPPLGISTGCRGAVGEGSSQRTAVGACPALHLFALLVPPGNNTPIFLLGTPSSPLSLHDCSHLYVTSGVPNPWIQRLIQGWTHAHVSSIEFTQNFCWSCWERGFLSR